MVSIANDKFLSRRLFEFYSFLKQLLLLLSSTNQFVGTSTKRNLEFLRNIQVTSMAVSFNTGMLMCI